MAPRAPRGGAVKKCQFYSVLQFFGVVTFSIPRILFWTDWDATFPRIEAASMSGVGRHVVFKDMETGAWPNGLTLDHLEKRIVWTDARYRISAVHSHFSTQAVGKVTVPC